MDKEIRDSIKRGESLAKLFVKESLGKEVLPENFPVSLDEIVKTYDFYKEIDTDSEFHFLKKKILRNRNIFIKSASAAAVVILLSITLFSDIFSTRNTYEANFYEVNQPGERSAILILNDSTVIDLSKSDSIRKGMSLVAYRDSSSLVFDSNEPEGSSKAVDEYVFNEIIVPRGGEFSIKLSDGTIVYLNSESSLKFPQKFSENSRTVYVKGEAIFNVTHDSSRPFIVNSGDVDVKVLGTLFNVRAYDNENRTVVTLNQGSVQILRSGQVLGQIKPDQQIIVTSSEFDVKNVSSQTYILWKDGVFRFEEEPLNRVLEQIGRWYDCRFDIEESLKSKKYTGIINKYDSIEEFISVLRTTGEFEIVFNKDMHIRINPISIK